MVSAARLTEAQNSGATTLAVGCPFCARMLEDANKQSDSPLKVTDVAEIVAATL
jgi:Fe-S oxidoreductase